MRRILSVAVSATIGASVLLGLAPVHGLSPVCGKSTPAAGTVGDPIWTFSYSSWTEPYASNALRYFYTFTNRTNHNVPVRWSDANIISVTTIPGQPIESDMVDATPAGLLNSTVLVGVEGAGEKPYKLKNCLSSAPQTDKGATSRIYGTAFHFKGQIAPAGQGGETVALDIRFRSEVVGDFLRYGVVTKTNPPLRVEWAIPTAQAQVLMVSPNEPRYLPAVSLASIRRVTPVETSASVFVLRTRKLLAIFRVLAPVPESK